MRQEHSEGQDNEDERDDESQGYDEWVQFWRKQKMIKTFAKVIERKKSCLQEMLLTCRQSFHKHWVTPGTPVATVGNPIQIYTDSHLVLCTWLQASKDQLWAGLCHLNLETVLNTSAKSESTSNTCDISM